MPKRIPLSGFTLLELMIAVTLGALILYAAMAGFRVASQTVTVANRLSLENSILRAGFQAALYEVDTWTSYDDPNSTLPGDQALRRAQMPFSELPRLTTTQAAQTGGGGEIQGQYMYPSPETDTGWDPDYFWPPNDSRTWWRANPVEWHASAGRSGNFAKFANTSGAPHTWLFSQMKMLQTNLGFYAFCDYLPPSMPYAYINNGDLDPLFVTAGAFRNGDGGTWFAQGRYRCTKDTSYLLVPLKPSGGGAELTVGNIRRHYGTGVGANENGIKDFMKKALSRQPLMLSQPSHWPKMNVEVARFLSHNRFVTLSTIQWTNALTGELMSLSFTSLGTTLRGARNMRKPGQPGTANGWARWYAPGDDRNDTTIDAPAKLQ
jgi:prepilin-type N-terminal cleavage/methylation domain-containing protein